MSFVPYCFIIHQVSQKRCIEATILLTLNKLYEFMGFTFSHPALILPVRYLPRVSYSMNGLIVGSMIPDLEYFIRPDNSSTFSHTIPGLFLFDLPAALIILTIYHLLIREGFTGNLPAFLRLRLSPYLHFNWLFYYSKNRLIVLCSILFGSITHLLWDSFTSGNGYFVIHHTFLETSITVLNITISIYKIIKHSSSLIGALILLYVLFQLPKGKEPKLQPQRGYWGWMVILTCILTLIQLATYYQHISANQLIKKIVSSGLLALIITSLYYRVHPSVTAFKPATHSKDK
jgi:hypothetical protein